MSRTKQNLIAMAVICVAVFFWCWFMIDTGDAW